jgi:molybdenum ABC transporter molybdate-binding protein
MQVNRRGALSTPLVAVLGTVVALGTLGFLLFQTADDASHARSGVGGSVSDPSGDSENGSPAGNGNGAENGRDAGDGSIFLHCAAGMKPPVQATIDRYAREYGVQVTTNFGGSGTLLSGIQASKRGDLYLAADVSYIDIAHKKGLLLEMLPLASMKAVIAVKKGNPKNIETIDDLLRPGVKFAIANPEAASVGKLTRKVLTATGQWDAVNKKKTVTQPTVNEIMNSVLLGAVDAAIIWDALVRQHSDKLEMMTVPAFDKAVKTIHIGVLKTCKDPAAALRFCRYLQAPEKGGLAFARAGFAAIDGDPWAEKPSLKFYSGGVNRIAIQDTIREFQQREGVEVNIAYNGCGILVGQMKSGERPDAYFSCDQSFMTQVSDLFPGSFVVSETDMVIAVKKGNPRSIETLADLGKPNMKVGVANAKQSALGALTVKLLKALELYDSVVKNVEAQTPTADLLVNQLRAGPLDAVIVYRANLSQVKGKLDVVEIADKRAKAVQPIGIGRDTKYKYLTQRLIDAITSAESKQRFTIANFRWRVGKK